MSFPISPTEGQIYNGYKYTSGMWKKSNSSDICSFSAHGYGYNPSITVSTMTKLVLPNTEFNNGGYYNTSNGRFTAPVDGEYTISCIISYTGTDLSAAHSRFLVNGITSPTPEGWVNTGATCSTHTRIIKLDAGDYVELYGYSGGTNITLYGSRTMFMGSLLN